MLRLQRGGMTTSGLAARRDAHFFVALEDAALFAAGPLLHRSPPDLDRRVADCGRGAVLPAAGWWKNHEEREMVLLHGARRLLHQPGIVAAKLNQRAIERHKARLDLGAERRRLIAFLAVQRGADAAALVAEYAASPFAAWYRARLAEVPDLAGTSHVFDLETLYLAVRAWRPAVVVETGVNYGGSSAHILAALAVNGSGRLYSIDLPADRRRGPGTQHTLVPAALAVRWELLLGDSSALLPALLARLGPIDHFHHDSLHTVAHMRWEYATALPHLRDGGLLSSHDVVSPEGRVGVYAEFCATHRLACGVFRNVGLGLIPQRL
jgi:predicted O-methyltransferase YrrM